MRIWLIGGLVLVIAGCGVGPKFKKPHITLPQTYSTDHKNGTTKRLCCWWELFENPELEELIKKGLRENFDLKIALEKIEESRNLRQIQTANMLPQITFYSGVLEANLGSGLFGVQPQSIGNTLSRFVAAETLWEIDIWGRLRKSQQAANYQWQAQIEDMRDVLIMLTAEIAQTYISICALQKKIMVLQDSLDCDTQVLRLYKDTFIAGVDNKSIPLEQATTRNTTQNQIIGFVIDQKIACHKLAFLLGQTPDQLSLQLDQLDHVPRAKKEMVIDEPYELLRRRPDIRKSESLLAASYEEIGVAMAEWFPKISLLAFIGNPFTSGCNVVQGNSFQSALGPIFSWPLLDFGKIYFNIKAKESSQRQALLTYQKAVFNAVKEVEDWLVSYVQEENRRIILEEKLKEEQARLKLTQDSFVSGLESEMTYCINKKRCNDIALELTDSEEKVASNVVALYKALGGDW